MKARIEEIWQAPDSISAAEARPIVAEVFRALEAGSVRAAEKHRDGRWHACEWVKKAILLHFRYNDSVRLDSGALHFFDKVSPQGDWESKGVRVVPPAAIREGAHVARGVIVMPAFINVGAYVGERTMVDTWSTIGSCAQVGAGCHISGGVGIGGVLEPLQASPVIIEDNCFIGARSEVAEGVIVREGAVLAMGSYVSASTKLYDATSGKLLPSGEIPSRAVVVPGALPSADGTHSTYALIIKKYRDAKTDAKTALTDVLR